MRKSFLFLLAILMTGAISFAADSKVIPPRKESPITSTTFVREFTLFAEKPNDMTTGVVLEDVLPDRAAKIRIKATGETMTVKEGGYCVCSLFGEHGLQVKSVDSEKRTVTFVQRWCE
jgi:hypothetical protein